jgi:hypothetical protein
MHEGPPATHETAAKTPRQVNADALQYSLLKPRRSRHALARASYALWRNEWFATLNELDGLSRLHSDDYTRQDEIGVLSLGDDCLSVTALRWIDLSVDADCEDSYFRPWPKQALAEVGARPVVLVNNLVIQREWRRASVQPLRTRPEGKQLPLAIVTMALAVRHALDSVGCAMGVARNDRAMNRVACLLGGEVIGNIVLHGIASDIILFRGDDISLRSSIVDWLWGCHYREPNAT